ncbi:hypothetical protein [Streptomyces sp. NPDC006631]|uniref:hypothetical protein n=1 Tax=Streptomyces sp. NPDC006631 TaxID=3364752 RepID=UPI00369422A8
MSNWQYLPPMGIGQPGAPVRANGGAGTDALSFRDSLDARRAAMGARVPSAEYPDGYLGTINDRRQDRVMQGVQKRLTDRSYQRGVHKGDKIDPGDYVWPDVGSVNPQAGLVYQARGLKWTQKGDVTERLAHGGKVNALSPSEMAALQQKYGVAEVMADIDPVRSERLKKLLPSASPHNSPDQWR